MSSYPLSYKGINNIIHDVSDFLKSQELDRKELLRTRLSLEEILMKYLEQGQAEALCELSLTKRFGQIRILLKIRSESFDPQGDLSEEDSFFNACMQNLHQVPTWSYRNGENRISYTFYKKQKISDEALNIGSIVLAVVLGLTLKFLFPTGECKAFCESYLDPVNDTLMGILKGTAIFFIFFSILNGICSMGDMATFNKIGRGMFRRIIALMLSTTVVFCFLTALIFPVSSAGGGSFDLAGLWQRIISIVPVNFVDAFLSGNTLQVSFLSIVIGLIILILGEKGKNVASLLSDLNDIIMLFLQGIIRCLPVSVFISILDMILTGNLNEITRFYKYPLFTLLFTLLAAAFLMVRTCISQKLPVTTFLRKIKPIALVALATSSSTATVSESYKICEEKLGIDKQIIHIGWPINASFTGVAILIDVVVGCLVCAEFFRIPVNIASLVTLGLNACILSMATPKVSGIMVTVYSALLGMLNIPSAAALALIIPCQLIIDPLATCLNSIIIHAELIEQADSAELLNKDVLRSTDNI